MCPGLGVDSCYELVSGSRALVVLGSSLTVMSGYRFVRHAARLGIPVAIVNQGPTRGDPEALLTVDAPLGRTLSSLLPARRPWPTQPGQFGLYGVLRRSGAGVAVSDRSMVVSRASSARSLVSRPTASGSASSVCRAARSRIIDPATR